MNKHTISTYVACALQLVRVQSTRLRTRKLGRQAIEHCHIRRAKEELRNLQTRRAAHPFRHRKRRIVSLQLTRKQRKKGRVWGRDAEETRLARDSIESRITVAKTWFWKKIDQYQEQPEVRFKRRLIVVLEGGEGLVFWSSYPFLNSHATGLSVPFVEDVEEDFDYDGKMDELSLGIQMPLPRKFDVLCVKILLLFDCRIAFNPSLWHALYSSENLRRMEQGLDPGIDLAPR
ncbi:hypothetical protein HPB51_025499 [Rhipicephalus microplus]|uniref:Transmembrane protein 231 n=1 Tax=Rhipicephalus microplus TaxID=6941 RepID=A0A9J6DDQ8_RHIMP|nr:hypothetical protein HPB51_025499 [Rhipicephalus microplus]